MKTPKKLRDLYMKDPAARKFLKENPEFDNIFLEQIEQNHPGFDDAGRYRLTEIDQTKKEYGELLSEAFNSMPDSHNKKALLTDYFNGMTVKELKKKYKYKSTLSASQGIMYAKKLAINYLTKIYQTALGADLPKVAQRTFNYKGSTKTIYLVFSPTAQDFVWVNENRQPLPDSVQRILDEHPDYKEWDLIFLDPVK